VKWSGSSKLKEILYYAVKEFKIASAEEKKRKGGRDRKERYFIGEIFQCFHVPQVRTRALASMCGHF